MPSFTRHNHTIYYSEAGQGVPILLGHSSASTGGQWKGLVDAMSGTYRCIAPDHIGYGKTESYKGTPDLHTLEVDALAYVLHLSDEPAHLVGHSYGGSLVSRLALQYPERARSLTLIEPTFFHLLKLHGKNAAYQEIRDTAAGAAQLWANNEPEASARGFIDYWTGKGSFDSMKPKIQQFIMHAMSKVAIEFEAIFGEQENLEEALAELQCPKLLIKGGQTTQAASGVIEILQLLWPNATTWQFDEGGHMCPVTHPEPVNERIKMFIQSN